jgi:hypothetical protein
MYQFIVSKGALVRANDYLTSLAQGALPGTRLANALRGVDLSLLNTEAFLELLVNTKQPQIYAESEILGNGSDWNQTELAILGSVSCRVEVTVYDDATHVGPHMYRHPHKATLLFVPGALLRNDNGFVAADSTRVLDGSGGINDEELYKLYEERLLPGLLHQNALAAQTGSLLLLTIPGIGCGQFAGRFRGTMGAKVEAVIARLLADHGKQLQQFTNVWFDPYSECSPSDRTINGIELMVRPLLRCQDGQSQLATPYEFDLYLAAHKLVSIVAWDHCSWPGNDFYVGDRATDDGVKAAATDMMKSVVGFAGKYDPIAAKYQPPSIYKTWQDCVRLNGVQLRVVNNLVVV